MPNDRLVRAGLPKSPTGITGFDEITGGGLPAGRTSLICGGPGSGKTLFASTFLVNGAVQAGEPGVFMSFEERADDLAANVASLGCDLDGLVAAGSIAIDHIRVERSEIEESGEYDLEGLFVRLDFAVRTIGAKRVVLDTIEALFSSLSDTAVLRSELRRLFGWLKDRGLTALITAEQGEGQLTRFGLEEYVSDCVVLLDNRVQDQVSTRRMRVVKYRGSAHETNEFPFLIDRDGLSVLPITAATLTHSVSDEIISTGIAALDGMFGLGGLYRGSSVLVSGGSGTGKTTVAAFMAQAACLRGERALIYLMEESAAQITRDALSVGLDLQRHVDAGLLGFEAARPSLFGLEMHLARMHRDIAEVAPTLVVIDPVSAYRGPPGGGPVGDVAHGRHAEGPRHHGGVHQFAKRADHRRHNLRGLSSLMDTWVKLAVVESNGEMNRTLDVVKARGMSHSNQLREFRMGAAGLSLVEPYIGDRRRADRRRPPDPSRPRTDGSLAAPQRAGAPGPSRRAPPRGTGAADQRPARRAGAGGAGGQAAGRGGGGARSRTATRPRGVGRLAGRRGMSDAAAQTGDDGGRYHLRLYVAGQTTKSLAAMANLKRVCEQHLAGRYDIEVIDLLINPQLAAGDQILAIPTLVRRLPAPLKRIIGGPVEYRQSPGRARYPAARRRPLKMPPVIAAWAEQLQGDVGPASSPASERASGPGSERASGPGSERAAGPALEQAPPMQLRLFVAGNSQLSLRTIATLRAFCERRLPPGLDLEVVDIYQQPAWPCATRWWRRRRW